MSSAKSKIEVLTAVDGCGCECPNLEIEYEPFLSDVLNKNIYVCKNKNGCKHALGVGNNNE